MSCDYFSLYLEQYDTANVGPLQIVIGDGQKMLYIKRITGQASAALEATAPAPFDAKIHQYLFSMQTLGRNVPVQVLDPDKIPGKNSNFNHQIGGSLLAVNGKCVGQSVLSLPFDYSFDPPVPCPNGTLHAWLECRKFVNVEIWATIQYSDKPNGT